MKATATHQLFVELCVNCNSPIATAGNGGWCGECEARVQTWKPN